jgi:rhamnosyltransferase
MHAAGVQTSHVVAVAIVLHEPDEVLLSELLAAIATPQRHLYIFINGPLAAAVEARLTLLDNGTIIRSGENVGQGAALNAVLKQAAHDGAAHVLLLDQDSTPNSDLPEELLRSMQKRLWPGIDLPLAVLGPLLVPPANGAYRPLRYAWRGPGRSAVHFVPTSGSLISLRAWEKVGPFRADYFIDGIDVEWGFRAWHSGFASAVEQDIQLVHRWGSPSENASKSVPQMLRQSDVRNYYYVRNAIDCLKQPHVPRRWKVRKIATLTAQIAQLLYRRRFDASVVNGVRRAILAGLRGELGPLRERADTVSAHP